MRIAILSDVHGNTIALDAVLADIEAQGGMDAHWVLGDLAALGPRPAEAIERLRSLEPVSFVRGNTDRYMSTGERPYGEDTPLSIVVQIEASFAWSQGNLTRDLPFIDALPLEQRLTLPDGTRVLGVHASPGNDDGAGIQPVHTDDEVAAFLDGAEADLVFVGHTHWPLDRTVAGVRVVNLGSVSNPLAPDLRAKYVLLTAGDDGHTIDERRVAYDLEASVADLDAVRHPARDFIAAHFRGKRKPRWA